MRSGYLLRGAALLFALAAPASASAAYDETQNWLNAYGRTVEHFSTPDRSIQTALISAENLVHTLGEADRIPERGLQQTGAWPWSGDANRGSYDHQGAFTGKKIEFTFPNGRGQDLAATVFAPSEARLAKLGLSAPLPGIVYAPGVISAQPMYYWFAQDMADAGYLVMTYDLTGQGRSEGYSSDDHPADLRAALATFFSSANPLHDLLDESRVGTAGHSLGANAVQVVGDFGGRVKAISAHSDMQSGYTGNAPLQAQGADYESFVLPPEPSPGSDPAAKLASFAPYAARGIDVQEVVIESATHLAWSHVTWAYTSTWSEPVAFWYALAWFDRYLYADMARKDGLPDPAGLTATQRVTMNYEAIPGHGVSKKFLSAYSLGGFTCGDMVGRDGCTQPAAKRKKHAKRKRSGARARHRRG
jgi:dienelactone hydrolase